MSLTLTGNPTAAQGETIHLTTLATSNGGETDNAVFGAINLPNNVTGLSSDSTQVNLSTVGTAAPGWSSGALTCTTAFCVAFSQVNPNGVQTAGITNLQIARTSFVINPATPVGTVLNFAWRTTPSTQRLDWYGLSSAPGVSVTVTAIPEPTTAALLGLGMLGLAVTGRRRA